ncbi:hypothetical protein C4546_03360 [Candidatus Parcubacteria bacterium]|jgi:hypothetical protein|nr:MAG: hypothetical protein C4546_03360 [Candidatus Parcubacteria bacterium]
MKKALKVLSLGMIALSALLFLAVKTSHAVSKPSIYVTGTLTAISNNTLPAVLTLTSGATTYIVNVPVNANIDRKYNGDSNLGEFIIGDTLQVWGKLSESTTNTIDAIRIRDISIQRAGGTFKGSIVGLDCVNNKFTFKPEKRSEQTVYLSTNTKIIRGGEKISCAGLIVKEKAKVIGLWRFSQNRIDADRVIVDMQTISGTITEINLTNGGLPATLTVALKNGKTWTVNVTSSTKLFRKYLGKATIEEFLVGDKVEARGTISTGNVLNAKVVRDNSISVKYGDFKGTVKSVDADNQKFVMRVSGKKYGDITVTTSALTKFYDDEVVKAFTDIAVGDSLKVIGTYTSSTKILVASRVFWRD